MIRLLVSLIMILLSNLCYSGTRDPSTGDQKYIEYAESFHYVGKLTGSYKDNKKFAASAVAIDHHHILTAAHVVENSNSCIFHIERNDNNEFCIESIILHQDFPDKFGYGDIAIGYSEKPFNLEFYPKLYDGNDEIGKKCSISGYGFYGTFISGPKYHDDRRRAGSNIVDSISDNMLICTPSKTGHSGMTSLEFMIASGDSGGGLFIEDRLAGINSCVMRTKGSPNSIYGDESGHTRISRFIEWINQNRKVTKQ